VAVCLNSKFTEAIPIKNLTAKATCEALRQIFEKYSFICDVIISDNATNFTAEFTELFYKTFGIEARRATPGHPQGNATVERQIQTVKRMLRHIFTSNKPREWHNRLPQLLWAYNSMTHDTTGISPVELLYGRPPRGPLHVLHDTWTNTNSTRANKQTRSAEQYLSALKEDLRQANAIATKFAEKQQQSYTNQYNKHAKIKKFEPADLVLILEKSSTNTMKSQWKGPAVITAIVSDNSYLVTQENGSSRVIHANDLRKFHSRVDAIGIIFDNDEDFGRIETYPTYTPTTNTNKFKDLTLPDHLSIKQKQELIQVLEQYEDVFNEIPGSSNILEHEIVLPDNFTPKPQKLYRIPDALKQDVEKQMTQLLEQGKVRHSNSQFCHPVVCVAKKTGDTRICVDFRETNKFIKSDAYPTPNIDELLNDVSPSKYITKVDCSSGYHQIPIKESDQHKTAFKTHNQFLEWTHCPFGLKTSGAAFQRTIDILLRPHQEYAKAYIDDCAVFSHTWYDHLQHIQSVLQAFRNANITLKLSKCDFAAQQITFVGHVIGQGKKTPVHDKVEAIANIPEPTTKKQLRSFLGSCNFYRNYVPTFSDTAYPLTELTKNNASNKIIFNDNQRTAFTELKRKLCDTITLEAPNSNLPYVIHTDCSAVALGATISQLNEMDQTLKPIAFISAKLTPAQKNYSTIERESYAIIYTLNKYDYLLFHHKIILYSDHNPLTYITHCAPSSPRLTRWSLSLSRYDIEVIHISGTQNIFADYLSRYAQMQ
jgi:Reverse transcriptase (RNA-dependent DNA polymerase)/RNase H-like domain found in reverse transcriptase